MSSADEILSGALDLPKSDRARIARQLIDSLRAESDPGADAAWVEELKARVQESELGQVKFEDWSDVQARVRARLVQMRQ